MSTQEGCLLGVCPGVGCLPSGGGGCVPVHAGIHLPPPPWTEFLTQACENIPLRNYVADCKYTENDS